MILALFFPEEDGLEDSKRHPQELSGDAEVTTDSRIIGEYKKEKKDCWRVEAGKGSVFKRGQGGLGNRKGERGEEGIFYEIQTSGLNIDPWQNMRTNHYGLICALRDGKTDCQEAAGS